MKIIKPGTRLETHEQAIYRRVEFTCQLCSCEFMPESLDEFRSKFVTNVMQGSSFVWEADCPSCGSNVLTSVQRV